MSCAKCDKEHETRRIMEDIQDRACKVGFPEGMGLTDFTDYLRGLYPELYTSSDKTTEKAYHEAPTDDILPRVEGCPCKLRPLTDEDIKREFSVSDKSTEGNET